MGTVHAKASEKIADNAVNYDNCEPNTKDVDIEGVKARVDRVHIEGLSRTKDDIVQDCFEELFKATEFQDILVKAHRARLKLDELGCFKNVAIFIDTSKGVGSTPEGLEITYNVKEYKRVTGGVSTHVGNNEGQLMVGMRAPNIFGRGERVQLEYTHGSKKNNNANLGFIKPFRGRFSPVLSTHFYQAHSEYPSSGYKELGRGIILDFGFHSHPLVKHNIQWEGVVRDIQANKGTSLTILENAGPTLKSALRYIISSDMRDDLIFPNGGSLLQMSNEFAGLGGEIGFLKTDAYVQLNTSLLEGVVLQGTLSGGFMTSISNDMKMTVSDMFFLGGPLTLRGFKMNGVGPQSNTEATGASAYWCAGIHLFTPLPFRPGKGGLGELFRTHFFANVGNIGDFKGEGEGSILDRLKKDFRVSYGLGLALRLGNMARIEINYCFPTVFTGTDRTQPGVQFGIGVRFV